MLYQRGGGGQIRKGRARGGMKKGPRRDRELMKGKKEVKGMQTDNKYNVGNSKDRKVFLRPWKGIKEYSVDLVRVKGAENGQAVLLVVF